MRWLAAGLVSLLSLSMIGGVAGFAILHHFGQGLPSLEKLRNYEPPNATRLYASTGELLIEYATEKRIFVPLTSIPKKVSQAFLAAEDKNFYEHPGIDPTAIVRAALSNASRMGKGGSLKGGSTITQQVVKNMLLSREQSIERKVKEAMLAFRISKVFTKDKVLELYLNDIYLGLRSYGVAAAALRYFDKSLDDLTLEESALLAALPKAPENYNPKRHYEAALERRNWVIERMKDDGYVTREEAAEAKKIPIRLKEREETNYAAAAFFAEEVRRQLEAKYGTDSLYEGGLVVHTTIDPTLQAYARDALRHALLAYDRRRGYRGPLTKVGTADWLNELRAFEAKRTDLSLIDDERLGVVLRANKQEAHLGFGTGLEGTLPSSQMEWAYGIHGSNPSMVFKPGDVVTVAPVADEKKKDIYSLQQIPIVNGAMMVMEPHTGRVLAMVGGYSHKDTQFNRATQAKRQPGSSFKPFVYLAGLESGFTPSTILMDAPIDVYQGPGLPIWRPKNYDGEFKGAITMRKALEQSRNVPTVRLALQVGIQKILDVATRLEVYPPLKPMFSTVLGSVETTLDRLVNAYCMFANGGKRVYPALIERIQDRKGKIIYRRDHRECKGCYETVDNPYISPEPPIPEDTREQVIDPRHDYQLVSIMEGVVQRGTAVAAKKLGRPIAGKTGTTNDSRDAWFIGFTPDMVAGVYVGFDNPRQLGKKETGGKVSLPAFIEFMEKALKDVPSRPFSIPEGIQLMKIDRRTGQPPNLSTVPGDITFEPFLEGQVPGYTPSLDVSAPIFDGAMPGSQPGFGGGDKPGEEVPQVGTGGLY